MPLTIGYISIMTIILLGVVYYTLIKKQEKDLRYFLDIQHDLDKVLSRLYDMEANMKKNREEMEKKFFTKEEIETLLREKFENNSIKIQKKRGRPQKNA